MLKEETLNQVEQRGYEEPEGQFLELMSSGNNTITVLTRVEREKAAAPFEPEDHTVSSLEDELGRWELTEAELDLLIEAEEQGKNRTTAINTIEDQK